MASILVIGLNPAWQLGWQVDSLKLGGVNRAEHGYGMASGKGINAARSLRKLGHEVWLLQILGGDIGKKCHAAVLEAGIHPLTIWTQGETRTCLTILDASLGATEIIGPSQSSDSIPQHRLWEPLEGLDFIPDALLISGTQHPDAPANFHAELLAGSEIPLRVLDSVSGLENVGEGLVDWIKVNAVEAKQLSDLHPIWFQKGGPNQFVTSEFRNARVSTSSGEVISISPPQLTGIRNPIGAGDVVSAVFLDGILSGLIPKQAAMRALAYGSASCLQAKPAEFDAEMAEDLWRSMDDS